MPQLQPVFDETAEQLASAATPDPRQAALAEPSEPSTAAVPSPPAAPQAANGVGPAANGRAAAPAIPSVAEVPSAKAATAQQTPSSARENGSAKRVQTPKHSTVGEDDGDEELDYGEDEDEDMEEIVMDAAPGSLTGDAFQQPGGSTSDLEAQLPLGAVVGPAIGPAMGPATEPVDAAAHDLRGEADAGAGAPRSAAPPPLRTVGPAMPPPELLAAAQEAALAVRVPQNLWRIKTTLPALAWHSYQR